MYRSFVVFGLYLSFAIAVGAACGPAPLETPADDDDDSAPRGGTTGSGGSSSGGTGNVATGGTGNVGTGGTGNVATGGTGNVGTGGTASGGMAGRASGGASAAAGRAAGGTAGMPMATGGTVGTTGGTTGTTGGTGGTVGTAGTGTSGSAGTGTSTVSCDTAFAVSNDGFVRAPMKGGACWHGYASAGADAASTGMPTSFAMCGAGCMLKVAGSLAAADDSYAYLGFNVNQANGASTFTTVKPTGTSVKITFTNTGGSKLRAQIAAGSTRWCTDLTTSPATIAWTAFKTECWGTTGKAYAMEAIDQIQINVPGAAAETTDYDVTLVSIEEI